MARRKNALSPEEILPQAAPPAYVVDDFGSAADLFIRDCKIRNLSANTIKFYQREFAVFCGLLDKQRISTKPATLTEDVIKHKVILRMMDDGQKETSINCVLRSIRALFNFLVSEGYLMRSPMTKVKLVQQPRNVIVTFTSAETHALLAQPDVKTFVGIRDHTIMALLLETGVRVRELCDISVNDIVWADGMIKIDGKGYKQRLVPFQSAMRKLLARYLQIRGTLETDALFTTVDNEPVKIRTVQDQLAFYGRRAGLSGVRVSPHTFRHTFAKMSVQNGADIFSLQAVLGHATLDMVRKYVNLFSREVRDNHRKFSPLEKLL